MELRNGTAMHEHHQKMRKLGVELEDAMGLPGSETWTPTQPERWSCFEYGSLSYMSLFFKLEQLHLRR